MNKLETKSRDKTIFNLFDCNEWIENKSRETEEEVEKETKRTREKENETKVEAKTRRKSEKSEKDRGRGRDRGREEQCGWIKIEQKGRNCRVGEDREE